MRLSSPSLLAYLRYSFLIRPYSLGPAMHIVAECAACGARFKFPAQYAGARVKSPGCRQTVALAHLIVAAVPDGGVPKDKETEDEATPEPAAASQAPPQKRGRGRLLAVAAAALFVAAAALWPDQ